MASYILLSVIFIGISLTNILSQPAFCSIYAPPETEQEGEPLPFFFFFFFVATSSYLTFDVLHATQAFLTVQQK